MQRNRHMYTIAPKRNRLKPILIGLVIVILIALVFLIRPGGSDTGNFDSLRNTTIRQEMEQAISNSNSLSRLGATSTSSILGHIRKHVYAIQIINQLNTGIYGEIGNYFDYLLFEDVYSALDSYENNLSTGTAVNESLSNLLQSIDNLSNAVNEALSL